MSWNEFLSVFPSDDKDNDIETIVSYLKDLTYQTSKYMSKDRASLDGEIKKYIEFLETESLPIDSGHAEDVVQQISKYFQRAIRWERAETMINITPPANLLSVAASAYASIFNPNFAQDEPSGYLLATELIVIKFLSQLAGWDDRKAGGIFAFGGKGTNLYAGKVGLMKAIPNARNVGISDSSAVIITNEKSHPCHIEICDWLGVGRDSCLILPTTQTGQIDLETLEFTLRGKIESGAKIACIFVNGGTTNEIIIDPIKNVVAIRDKLVEEYALAYIPHIHVDSVIGWAWLVYKHYDFNENPLGMTRAEIEKILSMKNKIDELTYADSFGVDFHKTGFCPYVSSCIVVKNKADLQSLGGKSPYNMDSMQFGEYAPFEWTLELTRSSHGPVSAYCAFKLFGVKGFQSLLYQVFSNGEFIRILLNAEIDIDVINNETEGFATLFVVLPPENGLRYIDYLGEEVDKVSELLQYNQQFYLFLLEKYERGEIGFRITFSKSYKPYGSPMKTGCLKIYQTSPIVGRESIEKVIKQLVLLKRNFDEISDKAFTEKINRPSDFVYRD